MKVYFSLFGFLFFLGSVHAQNGPNFQSSSSDLHAYSVELWQRGQYDSALLVAEQLIKSSEDNKDTLQQAKSLNTLGIIYSSLGDPYKSISYYEKALALFKSLNNVEYTSTSLLNLGIAYKTQGDYEKALIYLIEAASYFEQAQNLKYVSSAYNTIGNIFRIQKRYDKSLEYHLLALRLRKEIGYEKGIAGSLNNMGTVYLEMGQLDSALSYFNTSLNLKETQNLPTEKATTLSHIAEIYALKQDFTRAETYLKDAHALYEMEQNKAGLAQSYLGLARLHLAMKKLTFSEKEGLSCLALTEETGMSDIRLKCFALLKSLYSAKQNYSKALIYADSFITLNEQILGQEKQKSLAQLAVKYESEKKQRELEELNREKEKAAAILLLKDLQLEAKTNYNNTLILTSVLLGVVVVLLLLLFRDRSLFAKKLDFLLRELHHRVKNNFQVLLSLFNLQLAHTDDETTRNLIEGNSHRITAMMLIHSGLYQDKDITRVRVAPYIKNLMDNLLVIYDKGQHGIEIEYDMDPDLDIEVDKSIALGLLINELATNAFKYAFTPKNTQPKLHISLNQTEGQYHLLFGDNGPGIHAKSLVSSFGLKLAKAQVKQLKGTLSSSSENGLQYKVVF